MQDEKEFQIKNDCKFYNQTNNDCNAMTELICSYKKCKRYNTQINLNEIDFEIKEYSKKVKENGKNKTTNRDESQNQ